MENRLKKSNYTFIEYNQWESYKWELAPSCVYLHYLNVNKYP